MNSINNSSFIRQQSQIQHSQQTQQTDTTEATNKSTSTSAPSGMVKQDTSDVTRMGTAGRLKIKAGKDKEKENLNKIRKEMSSEKSEKADSIEGKAIGNFAKRKRSEYQLEDKDYARQEIEGLLGELEEEFTKTEALSILSSLKGNAVVLNDVVLQEAIEDKVTDIIQASLSVQMEIASTGVMPADTILTGEEKRNHIRDLVLGYTTQEAFLSELEKKLGSDKMNNNFSGVMSHTMADLSAAMSAVAVTRGGGEKEALYSTAAGISSLQQLSGVHTAANKIIQRMSEQYPTQPKQE